MTQEMNSSIYFEINSDGAALANAVVNQAKKQKVDLIALPTHSSFVDVLSFGSVVTHVSRSPDNPVLAIPVTYITPGDYTK